ncbi:MAG: Abi family protein [Mariprofundus sp.]|nr:Abi family protein [Mariprofundus sp.]
MSELQSYDKPAITIDEQIILLIKRGLSVPDKARAAHYLRYISYYRLSIYTRTFQVTGSEDHQFQDNVAFDDILNLYTFDTKHRHVAVFLIEFWIFLSKI